MLYCSGSICVGVKAWFGWGGVVSLYLMDIKLVYIYSTIKMKHGPIKIRFFALSWLITKIILRRTVSKTHKKSLGLFKMITDRQTRLK